MRVILSFECRFNDECPILRRVTSAIKSHVTYFIIVPGKFVKPLHSFLQWRVRFLIARTVISWRYIVLSSLSFTKQLTLFGQSALDQAFTVPPQLPLQPISTPPPSSEIKSSGDQQVSTAGSVDGPTSSESEETWKAEYEAQVQSWRAQSAEAREKAERERLRWESIRATEKEEAAKRKAAGITDESIVHPAGESSNIASVDTTSSNSVLSEAHFVVVSSPFVYPVSSKELSYMSTIFYFL